MGRIQNAFWCDSRRANAVGISDGHFSEECKKLMRDFTRLTRCLPELSDATRARKLLVFIVLELYDGGSVAELYSETLTESGRSRSERGGAFRDSFNRFRMHGRRAPTRDEVRHVDAPGIEIES